MWPKVFFLSRRVILSKPFLTYEEQIELLKSKGIKIIKKSHYSIMEYVAFIFYINSIVTV